MLVVAVVASVMLALPPWLVGCQVLSSRGITFGTSILHTINEHPGVGVNTGSGILEESSSSIRVPIPDHWQGSQNLSLYTLLNLTQCTGNHP